MQAESRIKEMRDQDVVSHRQPTFYTAFMQPAAILSMLTRLIFVEKVPGLSDQRDQRRDEQRACQTDGLHHHQEPDRQPLPV